MDPHPSIDDLNAGLDHLRAAPSERGTVEMIVARPDVDQRRLVSHGKLVTGEGLVGDNYLERPSSTTEDGQAHPEAQLNIMNSRALDLCASGDRDRWPLAGDQFIVDFDLSADNIPAGTRLQIGSAIIEVSQKPHSACTKFAQRFGIDAARWANSDPVLRIRGINAMVVEDGTVRPGDRISKFEES